MHTIVTLSLCVAQTKNHCVYIVNFIYFIVVQHFKSILLLVLMESFFGSVKCTFESIQVLHEKIDVLLMNSKKNIKAYAKRIFFNFARNINREHSQKFKLISSKSLLHYSKWLDMYRLQLKLIQRKTVRSVKFIDWKSNGLNIKTPAITRSMKFHSDAVIFEVKKLFEVICICFHCSARSNN